jgi:hypothetical protein
MLLKVWKAQTNKRINPEWPQQISVVSALSSQVGRCKAMSKVWPAHRVPWTKFSTVSVRKATAKICKKATDIGHRFLLISLPKVTFVFV